MVTVPIAIMNARRLITIANLDYVAFIVVNTGSDVDIQSDGVARTPEQWLQYIVSNSSSEVTGFDLEAAEEVKIFVSLSVSDISFATEAQELADAIGFTSSTEYYPVSLVITGTTWGDSRLILQGVQSAINPEEYPSIIDDVTPGFPEQSTTSIITTEGVMNDGYIKANDRDYFLISVSWFPSEKRELVKDFFWANTMGISEYFKITGVWKVSNSVLWQVYLADYKGLLDGDKDGSDVREFTVGVVVQPEGVA